MAGSPGSAAASSPDGAGRLPTTFHSLSILRALNCLGVGLSLAALTAAVFTRMFSSSEAASMGVVVGLPTLVFGTAWATALRHKATIGKSPVRWGWLASGPLAIANAACAAALLFGCEGGSDVLSKLALGAVLGATFGAMFWIPGLIATIVLFGLPILWGQRLATKGLAGEERGEIVVGSASAALAAIALVLIAGAAPVPEYVTNRPTAEVGHAVVWGMGVLGAAAGAIATALASLRERRRRRFVTEVEAGNVAGYRVEESTEGKVLVRVSVRGGGYRVADIEEDVFTLDSAGHAKKALAGAR